MGVKELKRTTTMTMTGILTTWISMRDKWRVRFKKTVDKLYLSLTAMNMRAKVTNQLSCMNQFITSNLHWTLPLVLMKTSFRLTQHFSIITWLITGNPGKLIMQSIAVLLVRLVPLISCFYDSVGCCHSLSEVIISLML